MPKLPCVSGARGVKVPARRGFGKRRQRGRHAVLRRGSSGCGVPWHREVDPGTLRGVLRQEGGAIESFIEPL
ncbi:MAG TPA: type II toxin-antitoxin system HicA family toxin [Verrucomicrobiota bacterium]|nr:type II toxin-antitoxin system HicA family toxin [Verrucomicrobiota bacterium]